MNFAASNRRTRRLVWLAVGGVALSVGAAPFSTRHMDTSVPPGDDFYAYAAGTWTKEAEIPADKSRWGAFSELGQDNMERIRGLLEEAAASDAPRGSAAQKVGDFYQSGMDVEAIEAADLSPLQAQLDQIAAVDDLDGLIDAVAYAHAHIGSPLFGLYVSSDERQSDRNILGLYQGGLSLPSRDYYFDERYASYRDSFKEHVANMFQLAGDDEPTARAAAETVFALETELAAASKSPEDLRDPVANYHKMTLADAAARFEGLPLRRFLAAVDYPEAHAPNVMVAQPEFYEALGKLLTERPIGEWKTYLRWHALTNGAPYLSSRFEDEDFRFYGTVLNGTPEQEPRWRRVANAMDRRIGFAVGQLYTDRYFPPELKAQLTEMTDLMKEVMHDRIQRLDWMGEDTKERALAKLATFKVLIGFPDKWRDYSQLDVTPGSWYSNIEAGSHFEFQRRLALVGQAVDKDEFHLTPQTVNAYIDPTSNRLTFLAGILQPPYFDPEMDAAVNWGGIGAIIGHEMTHAFDDQGRKYDASGNLNEWWTDADAERFDARAQKLVEQYAAYEPVPDHHVNGELTLGENIADLGGVCIGLEAFHRYMAKHPQPALIDGLTPDQRFFIAWAQAFRTKTRDAAAIRMLTVDPHSPGQVRAFAPLVNVPEFYEAFGIKEGDPMWKDPEERVHIW